MGLAQFAAMTVCIDISPAVHQSAGIGRYAQQLAAALVGQHTDVEYSVFYSNCGAAKPRPPLDRLPAYPIPLEDRPWRMRVAASHLWNRPLDGMFPGVRLFHATDHLLPKFRRLPAVFTLHDLAFRLHPAAFPLRHRTYMSLMMPRFLRAAAVVIAVSESTRRDAERLYRVPPGRIRVIHPGVGGSFRPASAEAVRALRDRMQLPDRFLLYLGTLEPRKNLLRLLEAFRHVKTKDADLKLVLAGRRGWLNRDLDRVLASKGLEGEVLVPGFVPDEDLPALYGAAAAFVYPSLYEGWGSPVLEALACGAPVVTSRVSSLPEVAGDCAVYVDPRDTRSIAEGLLRILTDPALRASLRANGPVRARNFSWERAARETQVAYRDALHRSPVTSPNFAE
jgi:glycosyltransferase involved in cell wall biosynthesis